ncbi:HET-domain-containing protein [Aspergillus alliaceus]|uniref:HET-domain-containing protein n=1 Tax=Petromyces alliaceus TaxID=209559 RepID=UPI0012A3DF64|nr:HET-domain-containing protein [Aspergillus alliaceus]KAB8230346.1 HET-domain-containing protein [Aspergillus alliaceus]
MSMFCGIKRGNFMVADSHQCINTHLLKTSTTELVEFTPDRIPAYAILSHTWEHDEVRFTDMLHQTAETRQAWPKVLSASKQALACGYEFIWDDTCSIDKSSSAELTEAIYSMFMWYENAAIRYAYLSDYTIDRDVNAPSEVIFFAQGWVQAGKESTITKSLAEITGIKVNILTCEHALDSMSTAQRISWTAARHTTRPEDMAYCLMGIFSEVIMKQSDDQKIFAWTYKSAHPDALHGLLVSSPVHFVDCHDLIAYQKWGPTQPYSMTNKGLRIDLPLEKHGPDTYRAWL